MWMATGVFLVYFMIYIYFSVFAEMFVHCTLNLYHLQLVIKAIEVFFSLEIMFAQNCTYYEDLSLPVCGSLNH